ncbi:MAG: ATP synthase subunit I [Candidatus Rokubacteria bacterium]|nr:ATP synthase subunit I [Candidatus Rokubacteria bacterium]
MLVRVTLETCALVLALAAAAAVLGGTPAGVGALAGGALAVLNFRWLAAHAVSTAASGGAPGVLWLATAGLRFGACGAACAALFATGAAHPVAVLAGFTALPCVLIARGLAAARGEG